MAFCHFLSVYLAKDMVRVGGGVGAGVGVRDIVGPREGVLLLLMRGVSRALLVILSSLGSKWFRQRLRQVRCPVITLGSEVLKSGLLEVFLFFFRTDWLARSVYSFSNCNQLNLLILVCWADGKFSVNGKSHELCYRCRWKRSKKITLHVEISW